MRSKNVEKQNLSIIEFEQNGSKMKRFENLNEVTSMRCCIGGVRNRDHTICQSAVFFS